MSGEDSGCYCLILKCKCERAIRVGSFGTWSFPAGVYVYTGSAQAGLEARLARHERRLKKSHWHIDYLRRFCNVAGIATFKGSNREECRIAGRVAQRGERYPANFGASDCRCGGHLVRFDSVSSAMAAVRAAGKMMLLQCAGTQEDQQ
ncbi:MAG TPA: GIY-YIG nuclease family protein [Candidatus Brocadiia bacterium]|nr:GIY-YIG nuclease family protein [Candidatus Brocadiia bacterium]